MDSRLSIIVLSNEDVIAWFSEFPQNIDAFLSMNEHGIRLWERGKEKASVSNFAVLQCLSVYIHALSRR